MMSREAGDDRSHVGGAPHEGEQLPQRGFRTEGLDEVWRDEWTSIIPSVEAAGPPYIKTHPGEMEPREKLPSRVGGIDGEISEIERSARSEERSDDQ